jgi:LmbE family N-acetylglucosaminyl deacetylase
MFKELGREHDFDLVINCACEHMFPLRKFREINEEQDPMYVLQSSDDDTHEDHINCVQSVDELIEQARIVDVIYSGSIKLHNGTTRFVVIGQ